jgi:hypothetical protein
MFYAAGKNPATVKNRNVGPGGGTRAEWVPRDTFDFTKTKRQREKIPFRRKIPKHLRPMG